MTQKLPLKEHLRNAALYQPLNVTPQSSEWKRRLINRYILDKQLNDATYSKISIIKMPLCITVPAVCLILVFASYFGVLPIGQWYENIILKNLLKVPPIGLKEILVLASVVNGLTFLVMKRKFSF